MTIRFVVLSVVFTSPISTDGAEMIDRNHKNDVKSHRETAGQPKSDIVELHGQPKSGTTWLEFIVDHLCEESGGSVVSRTALLPAEGEEFDAGSTKHTLPGSQRYFFGTGIQVDETYNMSIAPCVENKVPIWSEACVPYDMYKSRKGHRFVLIVRDPRAVVVSWAHYWPGISLDDNYFLRQVPRTAALVSLRYYWHTSIVGRSDPSHTVFNEDLVRDPMSEYYRIASFLRVHIPIEVMQKVVAETSAEAMREVEKDKELPGPSRSGDMVKVRTASIDGFRDEVDPHVV